MRPHVERHVDLASERHRELVLEVGAANELLRLHRDLGRRDLEDVALGRRAEELVPVGHGVVLLLRGRHLAVVDLADREEAEVQLEVAVDQVRAVYAPHERGADRRARVEAKDLAVVDVVREDGDADPVALDVCGSSEM